MAVGSTAAGEAVAVGTGVRVGAETDVGAVVGAETDVDAGAVAGPVTTVGRAGGVLEGPACTAVGANIGVVVSSPLQAVISTIRRSRSKRVLIVRPYLIQEHRVDHPLNQTQPNTLFRFPYIVVALITTSASSAITTATQANPVIPSTGSQSSTYA